MLAGFLVLKALGNRGFRNSQIDQPIEIDISELIRSTRWTFGWFVDFTGQA